MTGSTSDRRVSLRWARDGSPHATLFLAGRILGAIVWSPKREAWAIEDAFGTCLRHAAGSRSEALTLARAMVLAGQFPTPQQAQEQREARQAAHAERRARQPAARRQRRAELGKQGGDRRSAAFRDQGDNVTLKERGNSRAYITARLERDGHSELAAKVRAGKLSARAAAIEAGFRKQMVLQARP